MYTQKFLIFLFSIFILCTPAFATPVPESPPAPDVDHSDFYSLFSISVDNQPKDQYDFTGRTAIVPSICLPTPATNSFGYKAIYINGFDFQAKSDKLIREAYVVVHFSPLMMDNGSLVNNNHYNLNVYEDTQYFDTLGTSWKCQLITSFTQGTLDEGVGYSHSFGSSLNITESECTLVFRFFTTDGFTSSDINFQSYGLDTIPEGNSSARPAIMFTFPPSIGRNLDWRLRIDSIDYSLIYDESPDYTDLISSIAGDTSSIESILGQILAQLGSQINAPSDYYQKILDGLFGTEQVTSLNNVLYCLRWIRTRATQIHDLMADLANANGSTKVLDYDPLTDEVIVREYNNRSWWKQVTDYLRSINIDILQKHKYQQMSSDDGGDEVLSDAYDEASFWDLSSLLGFTSIADFDNDILSHEGESLFSLWFSQNNADAFVSSSSTNSLRSIDAPPSQGEYIDFWAIHSSEISSVLSGD